MDKDETKRKVDELLKNIPPMDEEVKKQIAELRESAKQYRETAPFPMEDDLDYRLKQHRRGMKPCVSLTDQAAIYIGSGPLRNATHIVTLVDSNRYILSDIECFKEDKSILFADCVVEVTGRSGFDVIREEGENIGFIMLDQAVPYEGFYEVCEHLSRGSYIYVHTIFNHPLLENERQKQLGLEQISEDSRLLRKK
ncbi:hypothetical protein KY336_04595 [Candidatus Woesearchaeota archaeon]|nr:hypothetical protein [Candidatus Woesearchaeota archaeon]